MRKIENYTILFVFNNRCAFSGVAKTIAILRKRGNFMANDTVSTALAGC